MNRLDNIETGPRLKPLRVVLYGVEGVGKTTWAAAAPNPIFICAEDGTDELNVARFPAVNTWGDIFGCIGDLLDHPHDFKTVVIDSADWAEKLARRDVSLKENKKSIEDFGYGKGYVKTLEAFEKLLQALDALRAAGLHVIMLAHANSERFDDPLGESYDKYTIACHGKTITPALRHWCDCLFFANHDHTITSTGDGFKERKIAKSYGDRVMFTEHRAGYDAKNRLNRVHLPEKMPLDGGQFWSLINDSTK